MVFKEGSCQIHEALGAQHMALFRRVVRNMVKQHKKAKGRFEVNSLPQVLTMILELNFCLVNRN
ncbi:hypothetical protein BGP78_05260 [Pseudoalteromonas sp. MSK9-3]|nr:hypothetical protein BGP78_05260 [Pseudoalteromonas sp. MSK9-3]